MKKSIEMWKEQNFCIIVINGYKQKFKFSTEKIRDKFYDVLYNTVFKNSDVCDYNKFDECILLEINNALEIIKN